MKIPDRVRRQNEKKKRGKERDNGGKGEVGGWEEKGERREEEGREEGRQAGKHADWKGVFIHRWYDPIKSRKSNKIYKRAIRTNFKQHYRIENSDKDVNDLYTENYKQMLT